MVVRPAILDQIHCLGVELHDVLALWWWQLIASVGWVLLLLLFVSHRGASIATVNFWLLCLGWNELLLRHSLCRVERLRGETALGKERVPAWWACAHQALCVLVVRNVEVVLLRLLRVHSSSQIVLLLSVLALKVELIWERDLLNILWLLTHLLKLVNLGHYWVLLNLLLQLHLLIQQ